MKTLLLIFLSVCTYAQTGTVDVTTSILATAGAATDATRIVCTGTPQVSGTTVTFRMQCTNAGNTILDSTSTLNGPAASSTVYSIQRGSNTITWILTKGNPVPDGWSVAANGVAKTGTF